MSDAYPSLKSSQARLAYAAVADNTYDDLTNPNGIVDLPELTLSPSEPIAKGDSGEVAGKVSASTTAAPEAEETNWSYLSNLVESGAQKGRHRNQVLNEGFLSQAASILYPQKHPSNAISGKGKVVEALTPHVKNTERAGKEKEVLFVVGGEVKPLQALPSPTTPTVSTTQLPRVTREDVMFRARNAGDCWSGSVPEATLFPRYYATTDEAVRQMIQQKKEQHGSKNNPKEQQEVPHVYRDNAFLLHQLLTPTECRHLQEVATPFLRNVEKEFSHKYRRSDRALIYAPKVAAELYRRILPELRKSDYKDRIPLCFGQQGVWVPFGLNDCIKITRYGQDGMFSMHRDGPWIPREDQASIYTVIIYLNEDFKGGLTELFTSNGSPEDYLAPFGERVRGYSNISTDIIPTTGTALLFNHDCWHGGKRVQGKRPKWILRTELIFQRVHRLFVDRTVFSTDDAYAEVRALYEASQMAMIEGRRAEFVELYQQVVHHQRDAMLNALVSINPTSPLLHRKLNPDVLVSIFLHLRDNEVLQLRLLNKSSARQVLSSDFWEFRAMDRFPHLFGAEKGAVWIPKQALKAQRTSNLQPLASLPLDWYTVYMQQVLRTRVSTTARNPFLPSGVVVSESGLTTFTPFRPSDYSRKESLYGCYFDDCLIRREKINVQGSLFEVTRCPNAVLSHFWPWHMNLPDGERFEFIPETSCLKEDIKKQVEKVVEGDGTVAWDLAAVLISLSVDPVWHPLLVVGHASWFDRRSGAIHPSQHRRTCDQLFELVRTPAIRILHPAVVAATAFELQHPLKLDQADEEDDDDDEDDAPLSTAAAKIRARFGRLVMTMLSESGFHEARLDSDLRPIRYVVVDRTRRQVLCEVQPDDVAAVLLGRDTSTGVEADGSGVGRNSNSMPIIVPFFSNFVQVPGKKESRRTNSRAEKTFQALEETSPLPPAEYIDESVCQQSARQVLSSIDKLKELQVVPNITCLNMTDCLNGLAAELFAQDFRDQCTHRPVVVGSQLPTQLDQDPHFTSV